MVAAARACKGDSAAITATKLSWSIQPATKDLATSKHLSHTEAVRRAIAIAKYIDDEVREGRKVQTVDEDRNDVRELILI